MYLCKIYIWCSLIQWVCGLLVMMDYLFCIVKLLDWFSMMREFVFVYNNV